jgi:hypothetical protein
VTGGIEDIGAAISEVLATASRLTQRNNQDQQREV